MVELGASNFELRSKSYRAISGFLGEQIARRRTDPGDNYISRLLASEIDGEPVADIMILNMCILILVAGVDTTWSTISSSLLHFATHPKDRQRLAGQPELLSSAVEEMLRLHAPASAGRVAWRMSSRTVSRSNAVTG